MPPNDTPPIYSDAIFDVRNLEEAKRIILTEEDIGSQARWEAETPYLRDRMAAVFSGGAVLDFGCGIGRLAKAWLDHDPAGCVIGVDVSASMRQLAPAYVASDRFAACSPWVLARLLERGLRFDGAVACWVIQHVFDATQAIELLRFALKPGAPLLVVNTLRRAVPTDQGWKNDGFDVAGALASRFAVDSVGTLPESATTPHISRNTFIGIYRKLS